MKTIHFFPAKREANVDHLKGHMVAVYIPGAFVAGILEVKKVPDMPNDPGYTIYTVTGQQGAVQFDPSRISRHTSDGDIYLE